MNLEEFEWCLKIFDNSPLPQTINDLETGKIIRVNDAFVEQLDFTKEEVTGKRADEFGSWIDYEKEVLIPLKRDGYIRQKPVIVKDKNGQDVYGLFNAEIIECEDKKYYLSYAVGSERPSQTGRELEKEKIKSRNYFELSPNLTVILDNDGKIVNINKSGCDILQGTKSSIIGKNWFETFLPNYIRNDIYFKFKEIIEGKATNQKHFPDGITNEIQTLDGELKTIEWYNAELTENGKIKYIYSTGIDITEKVYLEQQLRQAAKLEAIGLLAGGVAHDFNNILTVIRGYSEMLYKRVDKLKNIKHECDHDYLLKRLEKIIKSSTRATNLTKQLLAFSRKQILNPEVVDLNELIIEEKNSLHKLIREDIEISYFLDENLGNVLIDKNEMQNVIMNLIINARDAIDGNGNITIETKNIYFDDHHVERKQRMIEKGSYVMVAVTDDGHGMDKETTKRIFEPFFTTKEMGKGVGLGLSTVYGIVKQSGGYIWVYSEPSEGTTFKLYFPRVEGKYNGNNRNGDEEDFTGDYTGNETILVVEDEQEVREMVTETLRDYGYKVMCAPNGIEAIEYIQQKKIVPGLILTDVVMPKMDGRELAIQVSEFLPNIKVIYMSGYTDNTIVHRGVLDPGTHFIQKPTTPVRLVKRVREVLDE